MNRGRESWANLGPGMKLVDSHPTAPPNELMRKENTFNLHSTALSIMSNASDKGTNDSATAEARKVFDDCEKKDMIRFMVIIYHIIYMMKG
jgi:hypothetical protein